jgi:SAM-dependent methyltransferase
MINSILRFPIPYRLYQKSVRSKFDEYNFINFIFSEVKKKKNIRILDLCCGDSYVLNFISESIKNYLGVDNNKNYLSICKKKWNNFNFLDLDVTNSKNIKYFLKFRPNFIFMNGAIHHLEDKTIHEINKFILAYFPDAIFLSIDPVRHHNNFINQLMIKFDRGKFIRNKKNFSKLMSNYKSLIIDDFYKMSFQNIFHYRNLDLKKFYKNWKYRNISL